MVLVDTSVWIRALAGRQPFLSELGRLLSVDQVAGHQFVFGELLIGDRGGRREALAAYEQMYQAQLVPHAEAVAFARARRLYGRGIGWIDVHLLASAMAGGLRLWSADTALAAIANELGLAPPV